MKILEQGKKSVSVELSPVELELVRSALVKEHTALKHKWDKVEPEFPEELMYHSSMLDTVKYLKMDVYRSINVYKKWGILK